MEQRLFFKLLERWVKRTSLKIETRNGCLCLLPNLDYDIVIKSSYTMRAPKPKGESNEQSNIPISN